jgi:hypothetical protein
MQGAHMQYTKLGFNRLFMGFGSHKVLSIAVVNRSVIPNFVYCHPLPPI